MSSNQRDQDIWDRLKKQGRPTPASYGNISKKRHSRTSSAQNNKPISGADKVTSVRRSSQKRRVRTLKQSIIDYTGNISPSNVNKKVALIALSSIFVVSISVVTLQNRESARSDENVAGIQDSAEENSRITDVVVLDEPDFKPLFPAGTTSDDFVRKQTKQSPSGDVIFSFEDAVNGVPIEVTQQLLPDFFSNSPSAGFEEIAESLQLTTLTVSPGQRRIHYGVSERDGVQSLATLVNDRIMVFIRSPQPLAETAWQGYVDTLQ